MKPTSSSHNLQPQRQQIIKQRSITYYWGDRSLLINLGNRTPLRIKALFLAEFIFTSGMATVFLVQLFPFRYNFVHWAACLGISLLYVLAAHRFLSRMFFAERLVLDRQSFTIVRKSIFATRIRRYAWQELGVLHYAGRQHKTDHPLKGSCYDYFGFETQEKLIQNLHHEGNMYFDTPEGRIYFAAGVYSWTAEEMVQMMALYVGAGLKLGPEWKEMLQEQEFDDAS